MSTEEARVAHVWRRLGFGPTPGDVEAGVGAGGASAVIDDLLSRPATAVSDWQWPADLGDSDDMSRWVNHVFEVMAHNPAQVQERVYWILTALLVCGISDIVGYADMKDHHNRVRSWPSEASYKSLLAGVASSPGMQKYLTGVFSVPPHPNENLAREIMELFSLGVTHPLTGADNYTEVDITEVARALTGYQMDRNTGRVFWDQNFWDSGAKAFLGADRGAAKLVDVVEAIAQHDSYRYFVSRRIYTELTGLTPSATTLGELADVWGPDGDIAALVAHIARRPEFLADTTIGNKMKSPVELLVSIQRVLGRTNTEPYNWHWTAWILRQHPMIPPDVNGWENRWLNPSHMVAWSNVAYWLSWSDDGTDAVAPENRNTTIRRLFTESTGTTAADFALKLAGLADASSQTRNAINAYASSYQWTYQRACGTMQLVFDSPEFLVN